MNEAVQTVAEHAESVVQAMTKELYDLLTIQQARPLQKYDMDSVVQVLEHHVRNLLVPIQGLIGLRLQRQHDAYDAHSEMYSALIADPAMTRISSAGCLTATELPLGPAGMPSLLPPASMNPFSLSETNVSIALGRHAADEEEQ